MSDEKLKISPAVRLNMTFQAEMNLDQQGIFGKETYERYLDRLKDSEARLQQLIRSLFVTDAVMLLMISGQKLTVPGLNIEVSQIPVINEILFFTSAMSFFFLCAAFITNQCYIGIIDQFGIRLSSQNLIDPDFFNASRKHYDFFLKIFRPKLNIWGDDIYQSNRPFIVFCWIMNVVIILVVLTLPTAHLVVSSWSAAVIFSSDINVYGKAFLLLAAALINLAALLMVVGVYRDFTFNILQSAETNTVTVADHGPNPPQVTNQ